MTTKEYSQKAFGFKNREGHYAGLIPLETDLIEGLMGMSSESGEALDIMKKHMFQGHDLDIKALILEMGDVLWYMNLVCQALGISLDDVMQKNITKLTNRYGSGFSSEKSINRKE